MRRLHYLFSGDVQGVGFRYRALYAANGLGVTGWVKNLEDGTVEMEAQGSDEALARLPDIIEAGAYIQVEHLYIQEIPVRLGEVAFFKEE